jgi:hypothetical protein
VETTAADTLRVNTSDVTLPSGNVESTIRERGVNNQGTLSQHSPLETTAALTLRVSTSDVTLPSGNVQSTIREH